MGHLTEADLRDPDRLQALFDRLVDRGLVDGSPDGWDRFQSAAQHALDAGRDSPAMFAANVRAGTLHHSNEDERKALEKRRDRRPGADPGPGEGVTLLADVLRDLAPGTSG